MVGPIAIRAAQPVLECGRRPVKAVVGEVSAVSATVVREGDQLPGAGVFLLDPAGQRQPLTPMTEAGPGTTPSTPGSARSRIPTRLRPASRTGDTVRAVVNLDPHQPREGTVWLDMQALGLDDRSMLVVTDELSGESYRWGQANHVRLAPATAPAHIFSVTSCPLK